MEDEKAYESAKKRVEEKIGFYIHIMVYIVISALLVIINLSSTSSYFWAKWPIFGWGIGVIFHAIAVFVFHEKSEITGRMIEKEMRKDASKKQ